MDLKYKIGLHVPAVDTFTIRCLNPLAVADLNGELYSCVRVYSFSAEKRLMDDSRTIDVCLTQQLMNY